MKQSLIEKRLEKFKDKWKWYHLSCLSGFLKFMHLCEKEKLKECNFNILLHKNNYTFHDVIKYEVFFDESDTNKICSKIQLDDNLIDLMKEFPNFPWNFHALSENKTISLKYMLDNPQLNWQYSMKSNHTTISLSELIKKHKNLPWNWIEISLDENLTFDLIVDNLDIPWNFFYCCGNTNIPIANFLVNHNMWHLWSWTSLSYRVDLNISHILNFQAPWDWEALSRNPRINASVIRFFPEKISKTYEIWDTIPWNASFTSTQLLNNLDLNWDWYDISHLISDVNVVLNNMELPWIWNELCKNENIDLTQIIELHPKKIIWSNLSKNLSINWKIVEKYIDKPWIWKHLSANPSIDLLKIVENHDKPWHWKYVSGRTSPHIAVEYPDLPWNWRLVSYNVDNMDIIKEYPDMPWNWKSLSSLKTLKFDDILNYIEKPWSWKELSCNKNIFKVINTDSDFLKSLREKNAANTIKRKWHLINNNPEYVVARRRIHSLFRELITENRNGTIK